MTGSCGVARKSNKSGWGPFCELKYRLRKFTIKPFVAYLLGWICLSTRLDRKGRLTPSQSPIQSNTSDARLVKLARNIWACRLDLSRQIRLKCTITPHSSIVALHTRLHSLSIPWGPHCSIWIIYQFPLCYIQNQLFWTRLPIFTGIHFIVLLTNRPTATEIDVA